MAAWAVVEDETETLALVRRLNDSARAGPVVVVTTPSGSATPWIDLDRLHREVADAAEIIVLPTGPHTASFADAMPPQTQVYGGAGRVYPVGSDWVTDPRRSPLRLAFDARQGAEATDALIDDALSMATAAGFFVPEVRRSRERRDGIVQDTYGDSRAIVRLDRDLATIPAELAFPQVPIHRVLAKDMRLTGWYDEESKWFDVRDAHLTPEVALAGYRVGDLVLAEVGTVEATRATLFLHPLILVTVAREQVTSNDLDDLTSLLTRGEVLAAHVTSLAPDWALSLLDVDDDEVPVPAASLLEGGPPWLVLTEPPEPVPADTPVLAGAPAPPVVEAMAPVASTAPTAPPEPVAQVEPAAPPTFVPSPAMFDHHRARPAPNETPPSPGPVPAPVPAPPPASRSAPAPAAPGKALQSMSLKVQALEAELARLRPELTRTSSELRSLAQEHALLVDVSGGYRRQLEHQEAQLQQFRSRLRKAGGRRAHTDDEAVFADAERGFRHAVEAAWARRTPRNEQADRPLTDYAIGPDFLASLDELEGVSRAKVADVVFEIVTDLAKDLTSRALHQLRESEAGGSPYRRREADGATCWRVSLQVNTPSARRLHFWKCPDGRVELARVGTHDDFRA